MEFNPTKYSICNVVTGESLEDQGWTLEDSREPSSLIRAIYQQKQINDLGEEYGIYRYADWLPIKRILKGSCAPVTYKSEALAKYLGLENLYITFSGHFPKVGANMKTCSFKETEAYSVCGRMAEHSDKILVVSSAGNTARAFAQVCSDNNIPLLLTVPEDNLSALWFDAPLNPCVKLVASRSGADYFDAIHVGNIACKSDMFFAEGGAKNIARRDGMATTMLSATLAIGQIPDYYYQAVGSGTGAIAAWEANLRLIADGRFGNTKSKLMLSQNGPFTIMADAWEAKSRALPELDDNLAREQVEEIDAKVLSNRRPPYSIGGGLYDALVDTDGEIMVADNSELRSAAKLFLELEGVDIYSAPAVALATLIKSVEEGKIDKSKIVMLNITGGGEKLRQEGKELFYLKPSAIFDIDPDEEYVIKTVESLFK